MSTAALEGALAAIGPLDEAAMAETRRRLDGLTKPPGSLGHLEELAVWLAGVTGRPDAHVDRPAIVVAAADHGVTAQGVSAYPSDVTAQMVANFVGGGAAINVLARTVGASVTVVDVGVRSSGRPPLHGTSAATLIDARVRDGTADMTVGPAMSRSDAVAAIDAGRAAADRAIAVGADVIGLGEMGIGNTTAASALTAVLTGASVGDVTGRGTGIDDDAWGRKVAVIESALVINRPDPDDPIGVLSTVGGLEIAALVGVMLEAAAARVPVVLDGFITGAAALLAERVAPTVSPRLLAAHRSVEPGHAIVLSHLGLRPVLDLDLRLGEGTGAALAIGLLAAACRLRDEMATFESAGVSREVATDADPAS